MTTEDLHCEMPEWRPLGSVLPRELCGAFMYMGWLEVDGSRLHHYKHCVSRRYLFVNDALETYRYVGGSVYVPQARQLAIRHVFADPHWAQVEELE